MRPILRLVVRDLRATLDKSSLVLQLLLPLLFLFVAGASYASLVPPFEVDGRVIPYHQFLALGVILVSVFSGSLIAGLLFWVDRQRGMYEQILVGPFTKSQYAFSKIQSSMLASLGGAAIISLASFPILSGVSVSLPGLLTGLASIILSAVFFGAFALTVATLVRSESAANAAFNLALLVLMFLSTAFYPASAAPPGVRIGILLNPLTHAADLLRYGVLGLATPYLVWEGVALSLESIAMFLIAVVSFRRLRV